MKNIVLSNKDIHNYNKISEGAHATCIKYDDETAIKLWRMHPTVNENELYKFFTLNDKHFVFPRGIVFDENGNYIGYSMNYIKYPIIQNLPNNTLLIDILKEYKKALEAINEISKKSIHGIDYSESNTLFGDKFYFVDTDPFEFLDTSKENIMLCEKENTYEFCRMLLLLMIPYNLKRLIYTHPILNDMYINYSLGYPFDFDTFLEIIIERLMKITKMNIETYSDFKKACLTYSKHN